MSPWVVPHYADLPDLIVSFRLKRREMLTSSEATQKTSIRQRDESGRKSSRDDSWQAGTWSISMRPIAVNSRFSNTFDTDPAPAQ